jgi:hypothetical protein
MMALVCTNAATSKHGQPATAEPSPAGGWRARCPVCGSMWRLTPTQVEQLGLEAGVDLGGAA